MISAEEFANLTYDDQVGRLERMGREALKQFEVEALEIKPLVHFENTTFYVNSPQGEFNLRISRPGTQSIETLESEVTLLSALRADGFRVPDPWQNRIVTVGTGEVPESRHVALFRWMNGEFLRDRLSPVEARLIGEKMAQLHEFMSHWERPVGFIRARLHDWALQDRKPTRLDSPIEGFAEEDRHYLLKLELEARSLVQTLQETPESFGLIHSDLHVGNLLLEGDQLNVIDFDDTGFGYFLYDFGAALAFHLLEPQFEPIKEALLRGYEGVRPLPPHTRNLLNSFLKLRLSGVSRWIMDRVDNPRLKETGPSWVHGFCEGMRTLD